MFVEKLKGERGRPKEREGRLNDRAKYFSPFFSVVQLKNRVINHFFFSVFVRSFLLLVIFIFSSICSKDIIECEQFQRTCIAKKRKTPLLLILMLKPMLMLKRFESVPLLSTRNMILLCIFLHCNRCVS